MGVDGKVYINRLSFGIMVKVLTEKEAEAFLRRKGFVVVDTVFLKSEKDIDDALSKLSKPVVMKVSSKKIVHKSKVKGIKMNITNRLEALKAFTSLKKIKGFQGVLMQEQVKGKEYLVGLKKTPEFGYVVGFGIGGSKVEIKKKVDFRVCNVKGFEKLSSNKNIQKILLKLCEISEGSKIDSLDINPLILKDGKAVIVDSQIVFIKN